MWLPAAPQSRIGKSGFRLLHAIHPPAVLLMGRMRRVLRIEMRLSSPVIPAAVRNHSDGLFVAVGNHFPARWAPRMDQAEVLRAE
jgi:hypothetical protein